jgi:hypothetical protein
MSAPTAEMGQKPQVFKPAKIRLSAGLTSASIILFIVGGVLCRIGNAKYYDDDDGYYGFWAGGLTCVVLAALVLALLRPPIWRLLLTADGVEVTSTPCIAHHAGLRHKGSLFFGWNGRG